MNNKFSILIVIIVSSVAGLMLFRSTKDFTLKEEVQIKPASHAEKSIGQMKNEYSRKPSSADINQDYTIKRDLDGNIVELLGKPGNRNRDIKGFSTETEIEITKRASQIMEQLNGTFDRAGLSNYATVVTGSRSAQAFYQQIYGGYPVRPSSGVKVDLAKNGGVIRVSSDVRPIHSIGNSPVLDSESAMAEAKKHMSSARSIVGGEHVIWVRGDTGFHGYSFNADGKQIVINAENGDVLFKKDRRLF